MINMVTNTISRLAARVLNTDISDEAQTVLAGLISAFVAKALLIGVPVGDAHVWGVGVVITTALAVMGHYIHVSRRDPWGGPTMKQHVTDLVAVACYGFVVGTLIVTFS